jgi:branched-subunit amino acid transport protein
VTVWVAIGLIGLATMLLKAAGPVVLGDREMSPRFAALVDMTGPVLLTALVVTSVFASDRGFVIDAGVFGLAAAIIAVALRAPLYLVVLAAVATTALVRLVQ